MRPAIDFDIKQERFQGPLDLLLDLIEREKLPINEISLAGVTDEFLAKVKAMKVVDQEALAEFLVIAAQLMLIKSRSLLPHLELSQEEEESIEDLERRLELYRRLKILAEEITPKLTAGGFWEAFAAVLRALPQLQKLAEEKLRKVISLEERIRDIQQRLTRRLERAFSEIVKGSKEKVDIIVSFLAILELAKQKLVTLHQKELFRDIIVKAENTK
ncbi:MAG: segregation/condensation protein A [Candidatus Sungbacteria bacterium]|uniref:Segregation and condensation protein A n=1 Tax=Candidatus Sungiibacteriota bacterium TaxID=2750080 RepID=A0A931WPD3_9BACT|nr:segregation/condensation protein A [Candidatus Sungbacteria bacterium]